MSTLCHLSGLPIKEGKPVIVLPLLLSTATCHGYTSVANKAADIFHFPFKGVMGEYGSVTTDEGHALLNYVNENMANKTDWFKGLSPFAIGSELFATVKSNDGGVERGEWIPYRAFDNMDSPETRANYFHTDNEFDTCDALLKVMANGSLIKLGRTPTFLTYVTIDAAFFEKTSAILLGDAPKESTQVMLSLAMNAYEVASASEKDKHWITLEKALTGSEFFEAKRIFVNTGVDELIKSSLREVLFDGLQAQAPVAEMKDKISPLLTSIATLSSIYALYHKLGRTFLPQMIRANMETKAMFTHIVAGEIESRRASNRLKLINDGYTEEDDAEFLNERQWFN